MRFIALSQLSVIPSVEAIPAILARASSTLDAAKSSAEILEARDTAAFAYDAAKSAARIYRAKGAHDDLVDKARRLQGEALRIDARAKFRLAEEYDAAQKRGEVATGRPKSLPGENSFVATAADIGVTSKDIFEARQVRDAEVESPGIVNETIDRLLDEGQEPTRAAVNQAIVNRTSFTGNNQWFTPDEYIELARDVLGTIDLDPATHALAQERVKAAKFFTEDDDGLTQEWRGRVWLNPPYSQPDIGLFVDKLIDEIEVRPHDRGDSVDAQLQRYGMVPEGRHDRRRSLLHERPRALRLARWRASGANAGANVLLLRRPR